MRTRIVGGLLVLLLASVQGCSTVKPIPLESQFWQQKGKKVGVVLLKLPSAHIQESATSTRVSTGIQSVDFLNGPGRDEAEYQPLRIAGMKPLMLSLLDLDAREFIRVQSLFVEGLKGKGLTPIAVDQIVAKETLPGFKMQGQVNAYETTDYRGVGKAYGADYLVVIQLIGYGPYCHFIYATNDHMGVWVHARAELIDANTNRILWRTGSKQDKFNRFIDASCTEEDNIPIVSDAIKALLKDAAVALSQAFFSS